MNRKSAQKAYVSVWFLEFSVLWAVFPLLDQILSGQIKYWILALAAGLVVVSFLLVEGEH
jgi:hypothetical protein